MKKGKFAGATNTRRQEVLTLLRQGKLQQAQTLCEALSQSLPEDGDNQCLLAAIYLQRGISEKALPAAETAVRLQPDNPAASDMLGIALQLNSRLPEAVHAFRHAVNLAPRNTGLMSNLGGALNMMGHYDEALTILERALEIDPHAISCLLNYGTAARGKGLLADALSRFLCVLQQDPQNFLGNYYAGIVRFELGRYEESEQNLRSAIQLNPSSHEPYSDLGATLERCGRLSEAEECYLRAIQLKPGFAQAHFNLGVLYEKSHNTVAAISCYRQAITAKPEYFEAHTNLGLLLAKAHNPDAVTAFERAVTLRADRPDAHFNLAQFLSESGDFVRAIGYFETALSLRPDYLEALIGAGHVLINLGRPDQSATYSRRAIEIDASAFQAWNNLGVALQDLHLYEDAEQSYLKARELAPEYAEAHWNLALLWLLLGRYENAWREYEWRWRLPTAQQRHFAAPSWNGGALYGKTLFIHGEQGYGDTIQAARFLDTIDKGDGRIIIECQNKNLVELMRGHPSVDTVIAAGEDIPPYDFHLPMFSLPKVFGARLSNLPSKVPYLNPPGSPATDLVAIIDDAPGKLKVGLVYKGRPLHANNCLKNRSCDVHLLQPLGEIREVVFFSLQVGETSDQPDFVRTDLVPLLKNFAVTAHAINCLDLVICIDTAVAHLAGALGKPVWVMLPYLADWRWLLDRPDSPWYPTMILFRHSHPGDWAGTVRAVRRALDEHLQKKR